MLSLVIMLCGAIGVGLLVYRFLVRPKSRGSSGDGAVWLILHDAGSFQLYPASRSDTGGLVIPGGAEFSPGLVRRVELNTGSLSGSFYVVAVEPIALVKHRELEKHRAAIIKGALFKSGGDMVELLRICAAAAVIGCTIFVYMSISSMGGQLVRYQSSLDQLNKVLASPLVVQPGQGGTK